jgi:hypothetical protein
VGRRYYIALQVIVVPHVDSARIGSIAKCGTVDRDFAASNFKFLGAQAGFETCQRMLETAQSILMRSISG